MRASTRRWQSLITFDSHPNTIVAPDRVPPLIHSLSRKLRRIESLGADALLLIPLRHAFSQQTGEQFIRASRATLATCTASAWVRISSSAIAAAEMSSLLRRLGAELGFIVHGLAAVALDGQTVSSTRIRDAIRAGDLDAASQMLGRAYSLAGPVVRGDGFGRQLGFPTANIDTTGLASRPTESTPSRPRSSRPPLPRRSQHRRPPHPAQSKPHLQVEAHLLDFDADLYGQELESSSSTRLRDEKNFPPLKSCATKSPAIFSTPNCGFDPSLSAPRF